MLKNKKNIGIIILTIIVIILIIVLIYKTIIKNNNKPKIANTQNILENKLNGGSIYSDEQIKTGIDELNKIMKKKTNKNRVSVNGEKITEREIAFVDFQYNNSIINNSGEKINAEEQIIKEYLIEQDAKKEGITLNEEEIEKIEKKIKKQAQKGSEEIEAILKAVSMNYDEFIEFYIKRMKRLEVQTKWSLYIAEAIKSGELNTDNSEFNAKCKRCKKYAEDKEKAPQAVNLILELIEEYKELLKQKAKIEYIN